MTMVMFCRTDVGASVIADTLFRANGRAGLEVGPKIFTVPITVRTLGSGELQRCLDMGFAFAGFTSAGQVTHAIAAAALQNLVGNEPHGIPSVRDVADYYARCAVYVVNEMRRSVASDQFLFEGAVFGWEDEEPIVFTFDVKIGDDAKATAPVEPMDFEKTLLYIIGDGFSHAQQRLWEIWESGTKAKPHQLLAAVIESSDVPSVGGSMQGATITSRGVELKPILWVDETGKATGGYMGANIGQLGDVGGLFPVSDKPIVLPRSDLKRD